MDMDPRNAPAAEDGPALIARAEACVPGGWQHRLPMLRGEIVTLRELRPADAPALLETVSDQEVARFLSPPPPNVAATERFIAWTHQQRAAGSHACFAVTPNSEDRLIGLFQVRRLDPAFEVAEWGFALQSGSWGSGAFADAAALVLRFTFGVCGARRLDARVAAANARGNAALRKVGAVRDGEPRRVLVKSGECVEELLWVLSVADVVPSRPVLARVH